uniref:peptidylprolyl isomerase n=1 Tax=Parastrongyloides trichosuri TaxID=131310 RepID=A0A0N4ZYZ1_PARTI
MDSKFKKRKINRGPSNFQLEDYLKELPKCDSYEKSFMHKNNVTHVVATQTDFIITASKDGILKFWKKTHHQGIEFVKQYKCHLNEFSDLRENHNGTLLCSISTEDKNAKIFDVSNFDMTNILPLSFKPFSCCWIDKSRDAINAVAISDIDTGTVYIFDSNDNGDALKIFDRMHRSPFVQMTYSPLNDISISVDSRGMLEYWSGIERNYQFPDSDVSFESKLTTDLLIHMKEKVKVYNICSSRNGLYFATFSSDSKYRVFEIASGKLLSTFDESVKFYDENHLDLEALNISPMELARKKAVERDIFKNEHILNTIRMKFDYSSNILVYPCILGIKMVNIFNQSLVRMIATSEAIRICAIDICNALPFNENLLQSVAVVKSDNNSKDGKENSEDKFIPDPLIVASAVTKSRFYLFTNCEPLTRDEKNETDNRDVMNEKDSEIREKAIIHTTKGDIHVELYPNECPKAVENFCTHARRGYYNGHMFHRVIKNFIIQTGDPTGKGTGGESIWGGEFEDEFHHSLKFDTPYKLAMANAGPNTNGSQFFITVIPTEWLDGKNTLFGAVTEGFNVVNSINKVQTQEKSGRPFELINVISISLL